MKTILKIICFVLLFSSICYADTITVTDLSDRQVIQRTIGATTGSLSLSGTYTGTAPTHIRARVVQHGTSTEVLTWSLLISETISGGVWSGTLASIPQGGWYDIQVMESNATSIYANGSNRWGIGILIPIWGQSNAMLLYDPQNAVCSCYSGNDYTANDLVSAIYGNTAFMATCTGTTSGVWQLPTANGIVQMGNAIVASLGIPIGFIGDAASGSVLELSCNGGVYPYWTGAGGYYNTAKADLLAVTNSFEFMIWIQGESNCTQGGSCASQSSYYTDFSSFYSQLRTDWGTNWKMLDVNIGCSYACSGVRAAITQATSSLPNVILGADIESPSLACNSAQAQLEHVAPAGLATLGTELATSLLANITAPTTYTISGTVSGAVQSGVTITLSGTSSASTTTDGSGNYSFTGLISGSYLITATLNGYTFLPVPLAVAITNTNLTGENFISTTATAVPGAFSVIGNWIGNGQ